MTSIGFAGSVMLLSLAFLGYSYLNARLRLALQPARLRLASVGESVVADETIPRRIRGNILFLLDHAFSARAAWAVVFLIVPSIIITALERNKGRSKELNALDRSKVDRIKSCYLLGFGCLMSNSLLACFIFALLFLIAIALTLPIMSVLEILIGSFNSLDGKNGNGGAAHSLGRS